MPVIALVFTLKAQCSSTDLAPRRSLWIRSTGTKRGEVQQVLAGFCQLPTGRFGPPPTLRMNQLIPQNLNRPRCVNRNAHIAAFHAVDIDGDAIAQQLMQRLFGVSTRSNCEHNGLADTTG